MKPDQSAPSLLSLPAGAQAGGSAPIALLVIATLSLALLQLAPRADQPVMLIFPPHRDTDRAVVGVLAAPGWDLVSVSRLGPLTIAIAAPAASGAIAAPAASGEIAARAAAGADVAMLRRDAGAWLGLLAINRGGCAG